MKITNVEIENFKNFSNNISIELSRITLLYGKNGVGKSNLLRAFDFCRKAIEGKLTVLDFKESVYCYDASRHIAIRIELDQQVVIACNVSINNDKVVVDTKVTDDDFGSVEKDEATRYIASLYEILERLVWINQCTVPIDWDSRFKDKNMRHLVEEKMKMLHLECKLMPHKEVKKIISFRGYDYRMHTKKRILPAYACGQAVEKALGLVTTLFCSDAPLYLLESPEDYLHPECQCELGTALASRKDTVMIIESHSEHLMLRLLRLIRDTWLRKRPIVELRPCDLSVNVLYDKDSVTVSEKMAIDENGKILSYWPGGFFEERWNEFF